MKKGHRILTLLTATLALALFQGAALATTFEFVDETAVVPPPPGTGIHGIARVGDEWFMANFNSGWNVYDLNFNQTGTVVTDIDTGQPRGLVYDSNAGTVFISYTGGVVYECTTDGTVLNSFSSTLSSVNALAFNPDNDHLFALGFTGNVVEMTRDGQIVNSFVVGGTWTGAAYDAVNGTLLLMTSDDDRVVEYTTNGVYVDTPLDADAVTSNGQGLHYDSTTGFLHVTSQYGDIAIWQREVVVATENATWSSVKELFR